MRGWLGWTGRGARIRTADLLNPIQALYQAELHPDRGVVSLADAAPGQTVWLWWHCIAAARCVVDMAGLRFIRSLQDDKSKLRGVKRLDVAVQQVGARPGRECASPDSSRM